MSTDGGNPSSSDSHTGTSSGTTLHHSGACSPPGPDPVCTITADAHGQLIASMDRKTPSLTGDERGPVRLATVDQVEEARSRYDEAAAKAVDEASLSGLVAAIEGLLAGVYDAVSSRLRALLAGVPRVALSLRHELLGSLPIETAHRHGEPALFETTQLYRLDPHSEPEPTAPRRFLLTFHDAAISDLDVIALEQSLIRWVSAVGAAAPTADPLEPLIHVAGHDPTIPDDLVDPSRRAHVVLSGCRSLPHSLPAGVASVVGSLWDVDDHSSSSIMAAYHARLALGIGPVEALRQAQLLHRHLATGAWAAYVHVGAPI